MIKNPSANAGESRDEGSIPGSRSSPGWLSDKEPVCQCSDKEPVCQETRVQSLGPEAPLEKEMATHTSILAWRIPWTEESGGLQSVGA